MKELKKYLQSGGKENTPTVTYFHNTHYRAELTDILVHISNPVSIETLEWVLNNAKEYQEERMWSVRAAELQQLMKQKGISVENCNIDHKIAIITKFFDDYEMVFMKLRNFRGMYEGGGLKSAIKTLVNYL